MSETENWYLPFNNTPSIQNQMLTRKQARVRYPDTQFTSIRELYGFAGINSHEADNMRMNHILVWFWGMFYHEFDYAPWVPNFKRVDGIGIMEYDFSRAYLGRDIPIEIRKSDVPKVLKLLKLLWEFEEIDAATRTFKAYLKEFTSSFYRPESSYIHWTQIRDEFSEMQKKADKEEKKKLKIKRKEEKKKLRKERKLSK